MIERTSDGHLHWTEAIDAFIKDNLGVMQKVDIAERIGVTPSTITRRISRMNLSPEVVKHKPVYVSMQIGKRYSIAALYDRDGKKRRRKNVEIMVGTVIDETEHFYIIQHENYKSAYRKRDPELEYKEV